MPILGTIASSIRTAANPTYEWISTTTLSSATTTFTISNIPQTYTDLVIRASVTGRSGGPGWDDIKINFDGNTSNVYVGRLLWYSGTNRYSQAESSTYSVFRPPLQASAPNTSLVDNLEWYISNYSSTTTYKTIWGLDMAVNFTVSGSTGQWQNGYSFQSTSAITSMTFLQFSSPPTDIGAQTTVALYGIKRA